MGGGGSIFFFMSFFYYSFNFFAFFLVHFIFIFFILNFCYLLFLFCFLIFFPFNYFCFNLFDFGFISFLSIFCFLNSKWNSWVIILQFLTENIFIIEFHPLLFHIKFLSKSYLYLVKKIKTNTNKSISFQPNNHITVLTLNKILVSWMEAHLVGTLVIVFELYNWYTQGKKRKSISKNT